MFWHWRHNNMRKMQKEKCSHWLNIDLAFSPPQKYALRCQCLCILMSFTLSVVALHKPWQVMSGDASSSQKHAKWRGIKQTASNRFRVGTVTAQHSCPALSLQLSILITASQRNTVSISVPKHPTPTPTAPFPLALIGISLSLHRWDWWFLFHEHLDWDWMDRGLIKHEEH